MEHSMNGRMSYRRKKKGLRQLEWLLVGVAIGGALSLVTGMVEGRSDWAWIWLVAAVLAGVLESYTLTVVGPGLEEEERRQRQRIRDLKVRAELSDALQSSLTWRGVFAEWVRLNSKEQAQIASEPIGRGKRAAAALCYLRYYCERRFGQAEIPQEWPFSVEHWEVDEGGGMGELSKAVAFVVAEIEYRNEEQEGGRS